MTYLEEFQEIMTEYDAAVDEVQKNRRGFDGFMGLGHHPGNAACHEIMDKKVAELCGRAAAEGTSAEAAVLTEAVLKKENSWEGPEFARLMLKAIQRHALPVIPRLGPEDRKNLEEWYNRIYPRRQRLPAQEDVLKALKK